jgi:hypothetical protein
MRLKVVIPILLFAFAVLGVAVFLSRSVRPEPGGGGPVNMPVAQTAANPSPVEVFSAPAPPPVANDKAPAAVPPVIQGTNHAEYVRERVAELMELAMNDDSNSLDTIWSELSNTNKEIRAGALAAVVQFGDRSVTQRLRELAAQTEDPAEKAAILAAADHLDLPPLGELHRAP